MVPLPTMLMATTLLSRVLTHDPRIINRRADVPILRRVDDADLDLMESGYARRLPRVRVPHSWLSGDNENGAAVARPSFPLRAAIQQQQRQQELLPQSYPRPQSQQQQPQESVPQTYRTPHSQLHPLEPERPQYISPFATAPPLQSMSSEDETAELWPSPLLGPSHVGSSAENGTLPPSAMSTDLPSISQCMQCVQSCVGAAKNVTEAVGEYCGALGQHHCLHNADEIVACGVLSMVCCSALAVLVGLYERGS